MSPALLCFGGSERSRAVWGERVREVEVAGTVEKKQGRRGGDYTSGCVPFIPGNVICLNVPVLARGKAGSCARFSPARPSGRAGLPVGTRGLLEALDLDPRSALGSCGLLQGPFPLRLM